MRRNTLRNVFSKISNRGNKENVEEVKSEPEFIPTTVNQTPNTSNIDVPPPALSLPLTSGKINDDLKEDQQNANGKLQQYNGVESNEKLHKELIEDIRKWEESKSRYLEQIRPVLLQKSAQFEQIFSDYHTQLNKILQTQGFGEDVHKAIIEEETKRFQEHKLQLFGNLNAGLHVLENQISTRTNLLNLESNIVTLQSIIRGHTVRKQWSSVLKRIRHRNRIVREILETERVYVKNLEAVVSVFVKPLRDRANSNSGDDFITSQEVSIIFSNIELILGVNKTLLQSLEERFTYWTNTSAIGDVFLRLGPFLKLYIQYVNNYNVSLNMISHKSKDERFSAFLIEAAQNSDIQKMGSKGLENFQILPVQRIPRYELLLKDLVKNTDEDHPDFKNLCEALFKIQDVAARINESKRMAESSFKVIEVQNKMGLSDLVQPHRYYISEGHVNIAKEQGKRRSSVIETLRGKSVLQSGYLYLFNDIVILATKRKLPLDSDDFKFYDAVKLGEASVEPLEEEDLPNGITLIADKGKRVIKIFYDKGNWFDTISGLITDLQQKKSSLKLSLPKEQGEDIDDLISQLPPIPAIGSGVQSPASTTPTSVSPRGSVTVMKLPQLINIYQRVFDIEAQLFKVPIDLERLIPQYCQRLPPNWLLQIYERLQELKRKIEDISGERDQIEQLYHKEKLLAKLASSMQDGQDHIRNLTQWIAKAYPKTSADPNGAQARLLAAYLMDWYLSLIGIWDTILDEASKF